MIPKQIKVKKNELPDEPGVYFYYDEKGKLLYIGKATSLKRRVGSYFTPLRQGFEGQAKAHDRRIEGLVSKICRIDYIVVPTAIEALILESNQIKTHKPPYNIDQKDDKSFLYLVITNEKYPRPLLMRGLELQREGVDPFSVTLSLKTKKHYSHIFGPYTSAKSLRIALDLMRKIIPWSDCVPGQKRPCFNAQIGKCPGVCVESISSREYKKNIRELVLFFSGKKIQLVKKLKRDMKKASQSQDFELAAKLRNRIFALEHIRDIAMLTREETALHLTQAGESYIDLEGRIEAYDVSNISGTSATGSMVVFERGKPVKSKYRKFKIKSVEGPNDVGMMEEMIRRRLARATRYPNAWPLPEVMVIDGGEAQVARVQQVVDEVLQPTSYKLQPLHIIGLAKGFDRKQDRLVYDKNNLELSRITSAGKELFQRARDEAHRFAVKYHRELRGRKFIKK